MKAHLLQDTTRAGLFHLPQSGKGELVAAAGEAGFSVLEAHVEGCGDKDAVLRELGRALAFPGWYGANFDALHDCLTDPDWQPASGHVLLIYGLANWRQADPDNFAALADVFRSAIDLRRESGMPFWILVDVSDADIPPLADA